MMRSLTLLAAAALLSGCATRGQHYVPVVDTKGHDPQKYNGDMIECQEFAKQRMDAAQGAMAGAVAGALLTAFLAPRGHRNYAAGRGAGVGALAGAAGATDTQETIIKRCLAGRGYNVLN